MVDTCKEHSGVCSELKHLQASDHDQWKEINGMKRMLTVVLASTIITLIGVVANLLITMAKGN